MSFLPQMVFVNCWAKMFYFVLYHAPVYSFKSTRGLCKWHDDFKILSFTRLVLSWNFNYCPLMRSLCFLLINTVTTKILVWLNYFYEKEALYDMSYYICVSVLFIYHGLFLFFLQMNFDFMLAQWTTFLFFLLMYDNFFFIWWNVFYGMPFHVTNFSHQSTSLFLCTTHNFLSARWTILLKISIIIIIF